MTSAVMNEKSKLLWCRKETDKLKNITIWFDNISGNLLFPQLNWGQTTVQFEGFLLAKLHLHIERQLFLRDWQKAVQSPNLQPVSQPHLQTQKEELRWFILTHYLKHHQLVIENRKREPYKVCMTHTWSFTLTFYSSAVSSVSLDRILSG